jgi:hypothetical protein
VRDAAGWNRWQEATYLSREAWAELVDALAARDALLGFEDSGAAAIELKRRAAASGYRLDPIKGDDATSSARPM